LVLASDILSNTPPMPPIPGHTHTHTHTHNAYTTTTSLTSWLFPDNASLDEEPGTGASLADTARDIVETDYFLVTARSCLTFVEESAASALAIALFPPEAPVAVRQLGERREKTSSFSYHSLSIWNTPFFGRAWQWQQQYRSWPFRRSMRPA
jgi:hypothetical protein